MWGYNLGIHLLLRKWARNVGGKRCAISKVCTKTLEKLQVYLIQRPHSSPERGRNRAYSTRISCNLTQVDTGEARCPKKKIVSTIWASVWSKNRGGGGGPPGPPPPPLRAPLLNPPVNSNNIYKIYIDKYTNCSLVGTFYFVS